MSFASLASLLVASADLRLVQSVTGAIRAADANFRAENAGKIPPVPPSAPSETGRNNSGCPGRLSCCDEVLRERNLDRFSPASPACQPSRWTLPHTTPRLALQPADPVSACPFESKPDEKSPLQPPWAVLPWNEPAKQIVRVKVVHRHTDIVTKGSLIDVFI